MASNPPRCTCEHTVHQHDDKGICMVSGCPCYAYNRRSASPLGRPASLAAPSEPKVEQAVDKLLDDYENAAAAMCRLLASDSRLGPVFHQGYKSPEGIHLNSLRAELRARLLSSSGSEPPRDDRRFSPRPDEERLIRLDNTVWNYLGTRDPGEVGRWICQARETVADCRAKLAASSGSEEARNSRDARPGLPPGESPQRHAVCAALTEALLYVGDLADAADERTTIDLRSKEEVQGLARLMTERDAEGHDGSLGENTRNLWERIGAALNTTSPARAVASSPSAD